MSINPQRIRLALERVPATSGVDFEHFANQFLAEDFPALRPVGGMHDGGRDAFIHRCDGMPETFVQSSVTATWAQKIRRTIETLQSNGHTVRTLIYCTNHDIQKEADSLKQELRLKQIALDVRDREYFVTFANTTPSRIATSEALARQFVDPLLPPSTASRGALHIVVTNVGGPGGSSIYGGAGGGGGAAGSGGGGGGAGGKPPSRQSE